MSDSTKRDDNLDWESQPLDFQALSRSIIIGSVRVMMKRLREVGEIQLPDDVQLERLDNRALHWLEGRLRDLLRTLGGAR